jgi:hypothetical protein
MAWAVLILSPLEHIKQWRGKVVILAFLGYSTYGDDSSFRLLDISEAKGAGFAHRRITRAGIFSSSAMIELSLDGGQGRGPVPTTTPASPRL